MATWKKVIVSGSSAELAALKVDNLTSGQVVIGGGAAGNLSTTAINGTGTIVATTGATGLSHSGSFSGSFFGDGSGLSGVAASFPVTLKTDLASTDKFFINDGASKYTTYGDLLTDLAGTNLAVAGADSLTLATTITGITSISSTAFTGSLSGTSSYANNADLLDGLNSTAFVLNSQTSSMSVSTASFATTASYAGNADTLDGINSTAFVLNSQTSSMSVATASYVLNAVSASYALNSTTASFASNIASGLNISASSINILNNLSVAGTASFGYVQQVTGSAVIIGEEFIILNTQAPAARFAGLQIYDSGSNSTASIVWDSQNNHFVYSNASGSTYAGGGFMAGPRNTGSLGQETYPTLNKILRGQGGDHLYDSNITDDNTTVSIAISTRITGSLNVSAGITGSLLGTASYANNADTLDGVHASSFVLNSQTSSMSVATASFVLTASYANNANALDGLDSTAFAVLSSANNFTNNQTITGTLTVSPSSATELQVLSTGVKIGNIIGDAHTITGSVSVSGSVTATGFTGPLTGTASYASQALSSSFASTAATATSATQVANSLTLGDGLTGNAFNGSAAITAAVGAGSLITVTADAVMVTTSSLSANQIPKFSSNALAGSNISDTGTQVQIAAGASSGLSVAAGGITVSAGGVNVTGNSQFNNNVTVAGDLTVNGTTTFINTTNTLIKDQFVVIASGSSALTDAGIVAQYNAAGSGSAWFLEAGSAGTYGRWAVAYDVLGNSTAVTADEFVVTAKINQASNPSAAPTWGGSGNGSGNLWVTNAGDIFIYA